MPTKVTLHQPPVTLTLPAHEQAAARHRLLHTGATAAPSPRQLRRSSTRPTPSTPPRKTRKYPNLHLPCLPS